jgi:hypothetical protein
MRPFVIDLCCGLGGWAEGFLARGFRVVGFDVERLPYPGELIVQDVRTIDGSRFAGAALIVASPPCEEFSRHSMPWTRAKNPDPPDLSIAEACFRIAQEAKVPLVLENVKGAVLWLGPPVIRYGSRYLWGDGVPVLCPLAPPSRKERFSSSQRRQRAVIPKPLADWVAWSAVNAASLVQETGAVAPQVREHRGRPPPRPTHDRAKNARLRTCYHTRCRFDRRADWRTDPKPSSGLYAGQARMSNEIL